MKICFPVEQNEGLESQVYGHFGSAPMFVVVDTDNRNVQEVLNRDLGHAHGACQPMKALGGSQVDAIVVGGIGGGALQGLQRVGLMVFRAQKARISDNLDLFDQGQLKELTLDQTCAAHGQHGGQGAGHGHGQGCCH